MEALTTVAKYADATTAVVRIARHGSRLLVLLVDDGVGGADPVAGSGLRVLAHGVQALGGRPEVSSPVVGGTALRAEIPVA